MKLVEYAGGSRRKRKIIEIKTRTIRRGEREDWIGPDIPSTMKKSYRSEEAGEGEEGGGEITGGRAAASKPSGNEVTNNGEYFPLENRAYCSAAR